MYLMSVGVLIQVSPHLIIAVIYCYNDYGFIVNFILLILKYEWILEVINVQIGEIDQSVPKCQILCQISSYGKLNQTSHNRVQSLVSAI